MRAQAKDKKGHVAEPACPSCTEEEPARDHADAAPHEEGQERSSAACLPIVAHLLVAGVKVGNGCYTPLPLPSPTGCQNFRQAARSLRQAALNIFTQAVFNIFIQAML